MRRIRILLATFKDRIFRIGRADGNEKDMDRYNGGMDGDCLLLARSGLGAGRSHPGRGRTHFMGGIFIGVSTSV